MNKKRVTVYKNGTKTDPIVMLVPNTFNDFITLTSQKLDLDVQKVFTEKGAEICSIALIRDDDVLYVSEGEKYKSARSNCDWVTLNVGGKCFATSKTTLTGKEPSSMLARMFAEDNGGYFFSPSAVDKNGAYLIDRSPKYFEPLLNYLRIGQLIYDNNVNPEGILEEARFFGIDSVIPLLEQIIKEKKVPNDALPLNRREVVDVLIRTPLKAELRFQGVNLRGADLSKLDLRSINFKYANLHGCKLIGANLSWCCLERADLSHAILDGAQLLGCVEKSLFFRTLVLFSMYRIFLGVKSVCANMESASLKNCNFKDPAGSRANMEGVNLKGANLEGSDMSGVNLRVATLKNASLQNCDLRTAVFAGADLEVLQYKHLQIVWICLIVCVFFFVELRFIWK